MRLKSAPFAFGVLPGEDDDASPARLQALHDVLKDALAHLKVSLMDAQPHVGLLPLLQLREQHGLDELAVRVVVTDEGVIGEGRGGGAAVGAASATPSPALFLLHLPLGQLVLKVPSVGIGSVGHGRKDHEGQDRPDQDDVIHRLGDDHGSHGGGGYGLDLRDDGVGVVSEGHFLAVFALADVAIAHVEPFHCQGVVVAVVVAATVVAVVGHLYEHCHSLVADELIHGKVEIGQILEIRNHRLRDVQVVMVTPYD